MNYEREHKGSPKPKEKSEAVADTAFRMAEVIHSDDIHKVTLTGSYLLAPTHPGALASEVRFTKQSEFSNPPRYELTLVENVGDEKKETLEMVFDHDNFHKFGTASGLGIEDRSGPTYTLKLGDRDTVIRQGALQIPQPEALHILHKISDGLGDAWPQDITLPALDDLKERVRPTTANAFKAVAEQLANQQQTRSSFWIEGDTRYDVTTVEGQNPQSNYVEFAKSVSTEEADDVKSHTILEVHLPAIGQPRSAIFRFYNEEDVARSYDSDLWKERNAVNLRYDEELQTLYEKGYPPALPEQVEESLAVLTRKAEGIEQRPALLEQTISLVEQIHADGCDEDRFKRYDLAEETAVSAYLNFSGTDDTSIAFHDGYSGEDRSFSLDLKKDGRIVEMDQAFISASFGSAFMDSRRAEIEDGEPGVIFNRYTFDQEGASTDLTNSEVLEQLQFFQVKLGERWPNDIVIPTPQERDDTPLTATTRQLFVRLAERLSKWQEEDGQDPTIFYKRTRKSSWRIGETSKVDVESEAINEESAHIDIHLIDTTKTKSGITYDDIKSLRMETNIGPEYREKKFVNVQVPRNSSGQTRAMAANLAQQAEDLFHVEGLPEGTEATREKIEGFLSVIRSRVAEITRNDHVDLDELDIDISNDSKDQGLGGIHWPGQGAPHFHDERSDEQPHLRDDLDGR